MRICCFSDTHRTHRQVKMPICDMTICAGDILKGWGYMESAVEDFLSWFHHLPIKYKILVAGNHDRYIEIEPISFKRMLEKYSSIIYLEDKRVIIEGVKIYGSPHQHIFHNWAFNQTEKELKRLFSDIPVDTDILITHAPSYGVGDRTHGGENIGEYTLTKKINEISSLKYHIFGHVHEAAGIYDMERYIAINCAMIDDWGQLLRTPVIFEI